MHAGGGPVFSGLYVHRLDAKGRVSIPAAFRSASDGKFYVTFSPEGALRVFDEASFEKTRARLDAMDDFDPRVREVKRVFFSGPPPQECDAHGRIKLSPELRTYAELQHEVVLNGMSGYFELWDKARWDERYNSALQGFDTSMQQLSAERRSHVD
jgi:MraZ protein